MTISQSEFGWAIAALAIGLAVWFCFTGRIPPFRLVGMIERDKTPSVFWAAICALQALAVVGAWIALTPLLSEPAFNHVAVERVHVADREPGRSDRTR